MRTLRFFLGCGMLALAGCGGGGLVGGGDGAAAADSAVPLADASAGDDGATHEQACAAAASAYCAAIQKCAPLFFAIAYPDLLTCTSRLATGCRAQMTLKGSNATPDQEIACAAALPGAACDDLFSDHPPAACIPPPGSLMNGAGCGDDSQCESGFCAKPYGMTCGACGPASLEGSACDKIGCSRGYRCGTVAHACHAAGKLGASCDADHACVDSLSCAGAVAGPNPRPGTCQTRLPLDATCDDKHVTTPDCDTLHGIFCNGFTKKCQSVYQATAGQRCGLLVATDGGLHGEYAICTGAAACQPDDGGISGTCIPPAPDGTACDGARGPYCLPPDNCVGGICKIEDPSSCH